MPIAGISQGLAFGGGTSATISGAPIPVAGGFNIDVRATKATILARSGDAVGVIAFVTSGANQYDLMVFDGTNWQIYYNA